MSDSIPLQIAEKIQAASINRSPDPAHDINPSTTTSTKQPEVISHSQLEESSYGEVGPEDIEADIDDGDDEEGDADTEDGVIRPLPRRASLPPLPDLRFEQSYLASIAGATTYWKVAYITIRDQVLFPLLSGTLWALALHGWRYWNRNAQLSGSSIGARVRRWWWRTNNWSINRNGGATRVGKRPSL